MTSERITLSLPKQTTNIPVRNMVFTFPLLMIWRCHALRRNRLDTDYIVTVVEASPVRGGGCCARSNAFDSR